MPKTCGKTRTFIPDSGCDDCARFERELEEVKAKNTEQDGRLVALEAEDATLKNRVSALESDNTQSKNRLDALETTSENYGSRLTTSENKIDTLEDCCEEVQNTLTDLDSRITTNAQDIQAVDGKFANYYTKEQVYTQTQVDHLISQIETGGYEEVDQLPAVGDPNKIYLVPRQGGGYERWIYSNGEWKDLGGMEIDLSEYVKITDIPDMIHPVGDTVIRLDNVNPGTLYTGTTWQKVSEGRMLIGANSTYALGTTGGNATHTHTNPSTNGSSAANTGGNNGNTGAASGNTGGTKLTSNQCAVPSHTHGMTHNHLVPPESNYYLYTAGEVNRRTINNGTGTAYSNNMYGASAIGRAQYTRDSTKTATDAYSLATANAEHTHTLGSHTHTLNSHTHTMAHTHTQGDTGSSSNMPPYLAVNVWVRTA